VLRIAFAPGCYGTYILSCLCNYTTLMPDTFIDPVYDNNGSSHYFRKFLRTKSNDIKLIHDIPKPTDINASDKLVVILTTQSHILDYINNQNIKNEYGLDKFFLYVLPDANKEIRSGWNYNTFDSTPLWVLREYISLNIQSIIDNYPALDRTIGEVTFSTTDIFSNFISIFNNMAEILELTITYPLDKINLIHENFILLQTQHNIQIRCNEWVNDILNGTNNTDSPCTTIFDEAYVQSQLRNAGHELKCGGVNDFPKTSHEIKTLLY